MADIHSFLVTAARRTMSSKVSQDTLYEAVQEALHGNQRKRRKFLEMVELQISLKNYDPQKDKRFSGTVRLKSSPRPKFSVCVLGYQQHCDEAKAVDIPHMDIEALKKLNKNKKLVKKLAKKYDAFLASESVIKGRLGGSVVKRLPSAQVMIRGSWDRAPHPAPCSAGNLLLPLPLPLLVFPLSLCLSQINK
ncbi:60S ribosomal protein L10a-like [Mirounga leonina]|uniref:60S ribosomal protein L10a-like n=1 Tax=Mirounga leonina TaxID=9715 RepID=UPI00156BF2E7|nr:60S ribosomal protein L10a-like [Mirounga leonina]